VEKVSTRQGIYFSGISGLSDFQGLSQMEPSEFDLHGDLGVALGSLLTACQHKRSLERSFPGKSLERPLRACGLMSLDLVKKQISSFSWYDEIAHPDEFVILGLCTRSNLTK